MEDYWRPIEDFPGYRVSREGEVQTCWDRKKRPYVMTGTWRPVKASTIRWGYQVVNLRSDRRKIKRAIHLFVLEAFVGPRPEGMVCCHNDGDASNNRLDNLRWDTPMANTLDKIKHGTQPRGEAMNTAKLREHQVLEIRRLFSDGVRVPRLAKEYGVWPETIRKVVKRLSWTHLP